MYKKRRNSSQYYTTARYGVPSRDIAATAGPAAKANAIIGLMILQLIINLKKNVEIHQNNANVLTMSMINVYIKAELYVTLGLGAKLIQLDESDPNGGWWKLGMTLPIKADKEFEGIKFKDMSRGEIAAIVTEYMTHQKYRNIQITKIAYDEPMPQSEMDKLLDVLESNSASGQEYRKDKTRNQGK